MADPRSGEQAMMKLWSMFTAGTAKVDTSEGGDAGTVAAGTVGNSDGTLLAADPDRKVVMIQNVHASATIAARSGAAAALNTAGNFMATPYGYIVFEGAAAAAAIHAISDTAATPVTTAVG